MDGMTDPTLFDEARDRAHARATDPETSHEAAESLKPKRLRDSQRAVFDLFAMYGAMTDQMLQRAAVIEKVGQSPSWIRTRRKELVDAGMIVDTGRKQKTKSGRRAIVWDLKPA
jgi:hypothetical protein